MQISKIIISLEEPTDTRVGWLKPSEKEDSAFILYFYGNTGWTPVSSEASIDFSFKFIEEIPDSNKRLGELQDLQGNPIDLEASAIRMQNGNSAEEDIMGKALNLDLTDNEKVLAQSISILLDRVRELENKLANGLGHITTDTITINRGINQYNSDGNTVVLKDVAPSIIPEYIGQEYENTSTQTMYKAVGVDSASDWKPITK